MRNHQYSDYYGPTASTGRPDEQNGLPDSPSEHDDMATDLQNLTSGDQPMGTETPNPDTSTNEDMQVDATVETTEDKNVPVSVKDSNTENNKMEQ